MEQKAGIEKQIAQTKLHLDELQAQLNAKIISIGNLVHDSVPNSLDEKDNALIRTHGGDFITGKPTAPLTHDVILRRLNAFDMERGSNIAGHRGYFLRDWGVILNQALINYGLAFLRKRQYSILQTPFMMKREVMAETAQLSEFDEALYKVSGDAVDMYLIATSEQPISAFHRGEWLEPKDLPLRYAGYSTCFRKEAGAHGKDVRGIFRVHQFEKVEQFCFAEPEKSWEMFDDMIRYSEEFYQSVSAHFVIPLCSFLLPIYLLFKLPPL